MIALKLVVAFLLLFVVISLLAVAVLLLGAYYHGNIEEVTFDDVLNEYISDKIAVGGIAVLCLIFTFLIYLNL